MFLLYTKVRLPFKYNLPDKSSTLSLKDFLYYIFNFFINLGMNYLKIVNIISEEIFSLNKQLSGGNKLANLIKKMDARKFVNINDNLALHLEEIAEMLGTSTEAVRRWCRNGKLSSYNFGGKYVIMGSDLKDFLNRSKKIEIERAANH